MRVFYASLEQRSDFRRKAAEALPRGARERIRQHGNAMDAAALEELQVWVRHASTIAARGSGHDEEAARLVRGMTPGRLDMLGARRVLDT